MTRTNVNQYIDFILLFWNIYVTWLIIDEEKQFFSITHYYMRHYERKCGSEQNYCNVIVTGSRFLYSNNNKSLASRTIVVVA